MPAPVSAHPTGANPFADTEDQAALRQLARDVAERTLAPMARQGDETEAFPQASWDAIRQADLFGITIGEK
jgi:alkylation response protein AidB-like acyl-CoA dehydrogenase